MCVRFLCFLVLLARFQNWWAPFSVPIPNDFSIQRTHTHTHISNSHFAIAVFSFRFSCAHRVNEWVNVYKYFLWHILDVFSLHHQNVYCILTQGVYILCNFTILCGASVGCGCVCVPVRWIEMRDVLLRWHLFCVFSCSVCAGMDHERAKPETVENYRTVRIGNGWEGNGIIRTIQYSFQFRPSKIQLEKTKNSSEISLCVWHRESLNGFCSFRVSLAPLTHLSSSSSLSSSSRTHNGWGSSRQHRHFKWLPFHFIPWWERNYDFMQLIFESRIKLYL